MEEVQQHSDMHISNVTVDRSHNYKPNRVSFCVFNSSHHHHSDHAQSRSHSLSICDFLNFLPQIGITCLVPYMIHLLIVHGFSKLIVLWHYDATNYSMSPCTLRSH